MTLDLHNSPRGSLRASVRSDLCIFVALLLLLGLTVEAARHDLGRWNFAVAVLIAATKAALIALFFMRIRDSKPLTRLIAAAGALWLGILFSFTLADYWARGWFR